MIIGLYHDRWQSGIYSATPFYTKRKIEFGTKK
jgi:hypothetical protein